MLKALGFFLLFFLFHYYGNGQNPAIKFENLKSEHGLANVAIQHVMQDSKGFIWFGTVGGLHKYDGYSFTVFRHSASDTTSISDNNILFIFEDSGHSLWIGTRNGLNRFDPNTGNFTLFISGFDNKQLLLDKSIRCIAADADGYLWIAISELGLLRFDPKTERFDKVFQYDEKNPTGLSSNYIKSIFQDEAGNLWLGSDNGLIFFDKQNEHFTTFLPEVDNPNSLPNRLIKTICEDSNGNLWIGTDGGLSCANRKGDKIISFTNYYHRPDSAVNTLSNNFVKSIVQDQRGKIWIGTDDGLNIFNPQTKTFQQLNHDGDHPFSLINKNCRFLMEDRQGIIWIGTDGGVSKYDEGRFPFTTFNHNPNDPNSLTNDFATAVLKDKSGILWIGTNQGLNSYDQKTNQYKSYTRKSRNAPAISHDYISCIAEDSNGFLWVGTNEGLNKFNTDRTRVNQYFIEGKNNSNNEAILSLLETSDKTLMVGKWEGLDIYDPATDQFSRFRPDIIQGKVQVLFQDSMDDVWVGTRNKLIRIVKFENGETDIKTYQHITGDSTSISYNSITALCETDKNGIWIGTAGGGLNYFDKKRGIFFHYTWDDGLPSDNISAIQERNHQLWISTDRGLTSFDLKTKKITNYDQSDGLQGNFFSHGAAYKSTTNEFYFGGNGGLSSFDPDKLKSNHFSPPVYITEFLLFNKPVRPATNSILPVSIENLQTLQLTHEEKVFTLGFVALNFRNSSKNRYAYKMENFDDDWIYTNADRRFATYTNLKPGHYTFRVKASNNDGIWNAKESQLQITINPPFWETLWFYLLCLIFLASVIVLYIWLRLRSLRNIQATLVKEVAVRTNELTIEKEGLELAYKKITEHTEEIEAQKEIIELDKKKLELAQNTIHEQNVKLLHTNVRLEEKVKERTSELKNTIDELDFFVYRASHDLRGPIARIQGLCQVGQLEPDSKEAFKYLKRLEDVCFETNNMLSRLLRTRTISNKEIKARDLSLKRTITKIVNSLQTTESANRIKFTVDVQNDLFINSDPELIDILLENIVQNAIRYQDLNTHESFIRIRAESTQNSSVLISIEDNGIGIPEELRRNVFQMFFIGTETSSGYGLGLYEAKLIVKKIQGTIRLNSENKKTTEFLIKIPQSIETPYLSV